MKIADFSVNRPLAISMLILGMVMIGAFFLPKLPVDLMPDMELPYAVVITNYSGAVPAEVEKNVTEPMESVMSMDEAATYFFELLKLWREVFPNIEFIHLPNYPFNSLKYSGIDGLDDVDFPSYVPIYGPQGKSNMYDEIDALARAGKEAGISLYGVLIDNPHNYANGTGPHMMDLKDPAYDRDIDWFESPLALERLTKHFGMNFGVIFNFDVDALGGVKGGMVSDGKYFYESMSYINEYEARRGKPDIYHMESWYWTFDHSDPRTVPSTICPEDEPYTQTYLAKAVIKQVKEGQKYDLSSVNLR